MSTEVFVSYSSQDYEQVMLLVDRLRAGGVAVWVNEGNINAGFQGGRSGPARPIPDGQPKLCLAWLIDPGIPLHSIEFNTSAFNFQGPLCRTPNPPCSAQRTRKHRHRPRNTHQQRHRPHTHRCTHEHVGSNARQHTQQLSDRLTARKLARTCTLLHTNLNQRLGV